MGKASKTTLVEITERDLQLLQTLNAAGWLNTRQIRDQFFRGKSTNAVCKRLRKLVAGKYIGIARTSSTENALYRLARQGKFALIKQTDLEAEEITIPTEVPRKLNHFMAINDLRFSFEQLNGRQDANLVFFFSERELALYRYDSAKGATIILRLLKSHRIIPDALARIRMADQGRTYDIDVAVEFDAGTEHVGFFGKTKVEQYSALAKQHCEWLGDFRVFTFAESVKRIVSLMRQVVAHRAPQHLFYFASVERLDEYDWENEELFLDPYDFFIPVRQGNGIEIVEREVGDRAVPQYGLAYLPAISPCSLSPREDGHEHNNA